MVTLWQAPLPVKQDSIETSGQYLVTILTHYDLSDQIGCLIFLVKYIVVRYLA